MLKTFRDNLKRLTWVLWVVIAAFILIEYNLFSQNQATNPSTQAAARVGSDEITFTEFQRTYSALEQQYRSSFGENYTPQLARQLGLHRQAIDQLIQSRILLREAERLGLEVTDRELQERILEVPVFQTADGGWVGGEQYEGILRANNLSKDDFEQDMREDMLLRKLTTVLLDSVFISDKDVEKQAREDAERASIRFVNLPGSQLATEVEISDDEVAAHFEENALDYQLPEQRRAGYLSVSVNQVRADLEIPEVDLRTYYDSNQAEFEQQEQVKARHILLFANEERSAEQARQALEDARARIEAGDNFAAVATELSEDSATAPQGGDLGFFGRGEMTPQFEGAAFAATVGTVVGPIENDLGGRIGYHLILVEDKRPGGVTPFEEVENRIRVRLTNERARDRAEELAREIHAAVEQEIGLDEAAARDLAEQQGVGFETVEPFGIDDNVAGIGRRTPFSQSVFELEAGTVGEPVRIATGWALPVVLEVIEPRVPELTEVEDQVRAQLVSERQEAMALARLNDARESIASGEQTLDDLATELGLTVQEANDLRRGANVPGLGAASDVIDAALALEVDDLGGPLPRGEGAVLFQVSGRQHFDPIAFAETREDTRAQLRAERLNQMLGSLIAQRRTELDVSYTQQFVDNFESEAQAGG